MRSDPGDVAAAGGRRGRLVIADDDDRVRLVLAEGLEGEGFDVAGLASDGVEAVRLAVTLRPDAVLLDVRMPLLDGIQAAEQIRTSVGAATRIVVLSAYDDAAFQRSAKTAGADRFLVKGCPLADVVRALTSAT